MQTITHALSAAPAKPVTAFRIFRAGLNKSSKGDFVFDREAAQSVMAAYRRANVDLPLDREHDSLNDRARAMRSDAGDAMGWFKLELRKGELWAVGVTYTSTGAALLGDRRARYFSPAFTIDPKTNRVQELINVALVAAPALYDVEPLAASRYGARSSVTVGARLTHEQAAAFYLHAARQNVRPGVLLRTLAAGAASHGKGALGELMRVLDLPADTDLDVVLQAVRELFERMGVAPEQAPDDALAEAPDLEKLAKDNNLSGPQRTELETALRQRAAYRARLKSMRQNERTRGRAARAKHQK